MIKEISEQSLRRLPQYLIILQEFLTEGRLYCSASHIADAMQISAIQVRKDLAKIATDEGVPNQGRKVNQLIRDIETFLGYNTVSEAVIVGVGMLGRALISYKGFHDYGVKIIMGFDAATQDIFTINKTPIYSVKVMPNLVKRMRVKIGIITVPKDQAQAVCNQLLDAGVQAIWNFAPVHLDVPEHVIVHHENMAESLAVISNKLKKQGEKS